MQHGIFRFEVEADSEEAVMCQNPLNLKKDRHASTSTTSGERSSRPVSRQHHPLVRKKVNAVAPKSDDSDSVCATN
jgi:hypothetical protein